MKVIQDVCLKYACDCTVRSATKPPQPVEKSTAGASLLAQVIVAKWADHQPLHRQEKMFERHGIGISRKTMGGWMAQCAGLLDPLYRLMKKELLSSKVIGTEGTSVKVLDRELPFARIGSVPKKIVAPTSPRYSFPPVCIPKLSSISAAVRNRIVWLFRWSAMVARKIGTSRSWPNGMPSSGWPAQGRVEVIVFNLQ